MLKSAPLAVVGHRAGSVAGLTAGATAVVVLGWGLGRPALWLDESATVTATLRDWSSLWHLTEASEAPLVPFYALMKVLVAALPSGLLSPEVLFRLPSVVVAALAVGVLAAWVARAVGTPAALAASGALLLAPSFSRYGQEARPYAVALLFAVLATVTWSRLVAAGPVAAGSPGPRQAAAWYAASVALLTVAHVMAASLVAAHVLLAVADPGELGRRRALRRTLAGAGAGLFLALPVVAVALLNGRGPHQAAAENLGEVVVQLFTERQPQVAGAVVLLVAAVAGALRVRSPRYGRTARVALAWALVPPLLVLPLMELRPGLMTHRYLLFVLPGWAVLAGLGIVSAAELARRRVPVVAVVVAVLAGLAALQAAPLAAVRRPAGHGEDIRPALAFARSDGRGSLPLVIMSRGAVELAPYGRADEARLLGARAQRETRSIWPVADEGALASAPPRVVLLARGTADPACRWRRWTSAARRTMTACMPAALKARGYVVTSVQTEGQRWTAAVLERPPG